jgi:hypothetical protein
MNSETVVNSGNRHAHDVNPNVCKEVLLKQWRSELHKLVVTIRDIIMLMTIVLDGKKDILQKSGSAHLISHLNSSSLSAHP